MLAPPRVLSALIVTVVALAAATARPALAGDEPDTLREALIGSAPQDGRMHQHTPPVARYVSETGAGFILDRSGPNALFRMDRSSEIWALRATPAPGGDIVYKNDLGQSVLRVSRFGGMTLFTKQQPAGVPAALAGEGAAFRPPSMSAQGLLQTLARASARASRAADRLIPFNADVTGGSEFVVADAAGVVAEALVQMAALRDGRPYVDRVKQVRLFVGRKSEARFRNGVVEIVVSPRDGIAGRPSSGRVAKAIVDEG